MTVRTEPPVADTEDVALAVAGDADKLVLASGKPGSRKFYIGRGVWADMILGYSNGACVPLPWTFPDFKEGRYDRVMGVIRQKLKAEMRR
jgi:hypothetical protein